MQLMEMTNKAHLAVYRDQIPSLVFVVWVMVTVGSDVHSSWPVVNILSTVVQHSNC